jgi:hypothetical protein
LATKITFFATKKFHGQIKSGQSPFLLTKVGKDFLQKSAQKIKNKRGF